MAIIPTNSNSINISNLPKAQLAAPTDLLLLQTTNGTQVIPFKNFNVVQTDVYGNATVVGSLSGNNTTFTSINCTSLTASNISTAFGPGTTQAFGAANFFTIQNGIILSAASIIGTDPVYQQLYNNDVPRLITQYTSAFRAVADVQGQTIIGSTNTSIQNTSAIGVAIGSFFSRYPFISIAQLTPVNFSLVIDYSTLSQTASSIRAYVPQASIVQPINTYDLNFNINLTSPVPAVDVSNGGITVYYRVNVTTS
jgi:hypothetical protein